MAKRSDLIEILKEAFLTSPDAVLLVDSSGEVVFATPSFEQETACSFEALEKCLVNSFWEKADSKVGMPKLCEQWEGPVRWKGEDGSSIMLYLEICALNQSGGYLLRASGVGDKGALIKTRRVEQQQKLEALGMYAGSVAHDLNNVLTGVLGHVSFLRLSLPADGEYQDSLAAIEDGTKRAAAMTQQTLEFTKGQESAFSAVNMSMVVSAAVNLLRISLSSSVSLTVVGAEQDLYVYGDESQLSQLVMNLAINARDALLDGTSGGGGRVEITLEPITFSQEKAANEHGLVVGDYIKFTICDDGVGIPAEIREKIFEPFFTTKSSSGTGLGLATVLSIIEAHDGVIRFESEQGQGTYFEVYLPAAGAVDEIVNSQEKKETLPCGVERILVVDDEESVRTIIQKSLEHLGYAVDVAVNGQEGIVAYKESPKPYSLVILDMIMPKMSGDEVFADLIKYDPSVRVLIASGYASDVRTKGVLKGGGLGFIQKPFTVDELALEVRRCLDVKR